MIDVALVVLGAFSITSTAETPTDRVVQMVGCALIIFGVAYGVANGI